jgi:hypothetical protein
LYRSNCSRLGRIERDDNDDDRDRVRSSTTSLICIVGVGSLIKKSFSE